MRFVFMGNEFQESILLFYWAKRVIFIFSFGFEVFLLLLFTSVTSRTRVIYIDWDLMGMHMKNEKGMIS